MLPTTECPTDSSLQQRELTGNGTSPTTNSSQRSKRNAAAMAAPAIVVAAKQGEISAARR